MARGVALPPPRAGEDGVEAHARLRPMAAEPPRLLGAEMRQHVVVARAGGRLTVADEDDFVHRRNLVPRPINRNRTEAAGAPGWQGARRENTRRYLTDEQRG